MTKLPELCMALGWGFALGAYHFGGLWWTVRRLPGRARPGRFLAASFGLRLVPVMLGLALVLERGPVPLAVAVGGLLAVRMVLTGRISRGA